MDENVQIVSNPVEGSTRREIGFLQSEPKPKKKNNTSAVLGLVLLVVVIATSVVGSYEWRRALNIKRVFVEGNRIVPATEVVLLTKVKAGTLMYDIDLEEIRNNILSQHYVKSLDVVRELPDALRISVEERQPIAAISSDRMLFLDEEGVLLPPYENAMFDVPFITGFEESVHVSVGKPVVNTQILLALTLLRLAQNTDQEIYQLVSEVHLEPNGDFVLYSADAGVKILLGKRDEVKKLLILKTFWNQFVHQRSPDRLRLVDLRYEDQVIARWIQERSPAKDGTRNAALYH